MRYAVILFCVLCISVGCKKSATCPDLQGEWILTEMFQADVKTFVADTSVICEKLVITASNTFVSSSNKTREVWNTGTFDCSKVFDTDNISFKKGSKYFYNKYTKQ